MKAIGVRDNVRCISMIDLFGQRVMIISPHSDDEWFSSGGTLYRLVERGCAVFPVLIIAGDVYLNHAPGNMIKGKTRWEEFKKVSEQYGGKPLGPFIESNDGSLHTRPMDSLVGFLDRLIREVKPDTFLFPEPSFHQDHVTVHDACLAALRPSSRSSIRCAMRYEEPGSQVGFAGRSNFHPNVYVDVSDFAEAKIEVYKTHYCTQYSKFDRGVYSEEGLLNWMRYRGNEANVEYAECFELVKVRL